MPYTEKQFCDLYTKVFGTSPDRETTLTWIAMSSFQKQQYWDYLNLLKG